MTNKKKKGRKTLCRKNTGTLSAEDARWTCIKYGGKKGERGEKRDSSDQAWNKERTGNVGRKKRRINVVGTEQSMHDRKSTEDEYGKKEARKEVKYE